MTKQRINIFLGATNKTAWPDFCFLKKIFAAESLIFFDFHVALENSFAIVHIVKIVILYLYFFSGYNTLTC